VPEQGAPLLEVSGVHRAFRTARGQLTAVDGVDLTVRSGEAVALVGESGSGKTTLARMIVGLDEPNDGTIRFRGLDRRTERRRALGALHENVSMVFQDPYGSLNPKLPVGHSVEEPLVVHRRGSRVERRRRVDELLESVGLDRSHATRRPGALSGGQRQRAAIARAIALDPQLVVLDEPVSALDVSVQAQVLNLLRDLRERLGLAYLFVSHDLAVVRHVTDRVGVMYLGRIVEEGTTDEVFANASHPYTIALLSGAMDLGDEGSERIVLAGDAPSPLATPPGCRFHPRCFRARERCGGDDPRLTEYAGHRNACHYPGPHRPDESRTELSESRRRGHE
jgi:oligopeptide transport system ATP-binding protein